MRQRKKVLLTTFLTSTLLLPALGLALDAETQALERAVLCQAMPYRPECGGTPPIKPAAPKAQAPARPAERLGTPVYTPPVAEPVKPGKEDFIRAASALCLVDLNYYHAMVPTVSRTEAFIACVRAYLAREGYTLP